MTIKTMEEIVADYAVAETIKRRESNECRRANLASVLFELDYEGRSFSYSKVEKMARSKLIDINA